MRADYNSDNSFNNRNKKSNNKNKNKSNKHNNNNNDKHNNDNGNNNKYNINNSNNSNKNNKSSKILDIQIGERNFCLSSESLKYDAPNFFTAAFFGQFSESKTTSIFIERDPIYFSMIVKYLRGYEVDWPINDKTSMNNLLNDVRFYGFERLQNLLEEICEKNFPENVIPWKILTYASESDPIAVLNIEDVELERWDSHSLVYDTNPISKKNKNEDDQESDNTLAEDNTNSTSNDNNDVVANAATDDDNVANNENNEQNNPDNNIIVPNPEKGLYRLEIHGRGALANVTSSCNNGIKFENFVLKNFEDDRVFRTLTESFRTPEGSLTLTPSLKLPFLKYACVEIDGSKYYTYNDLSAYFGTTKGKPLYFEEIVVRIDEGASLMRARAWTIPFYYASQPFVCPVKYMK